MGEGKIGIKAILIASFTGIAQVIFVENALTGVFFLAAIAFYSPVVALAAFLASCLAICFGLIAGANKIMLKQGLYSFNPILTAIALCLFLDGPAAFPLALLGAIITTLFTLLMMNLLKNTGLPILTFPFIIVTWLFILASHSLPVIDLVETTAIKSEAIPFFQVILHGLGQVFLLPQFISALLVLIGLFIGGFNYGFAGIIGSMVAVLTANLLGAEVSDVAAGLYGFNSVLTIIAVAIVFKESARYPYITGVFAAFFAVIMTGSIANFSGYYQLPGLTLPFVLTTWIILGARKEWAKI